MTGGLLVTFAALSLAAGGTPGGSAGVTPVPVACPAGTVRRGFLPPEGFEQWCEKSGRPGSAVRHGPYRAWQGAAQPFIEAEYCNGTRCGRYTEWYADGKPKSLGEFDPKGRYQGHWSFWSQDGSLIQQDFANGELQKSVSSGAPGATASAGGAVPAPGAGTGGSASPPAASAPAAPVQSGPPGPPPPPLAETRPPPPTGPGAAPGGILPPPPPGNSPGSYTQERVEPTAAIVCPQGAIPAGDPYPLGLVQWCQKRDFYGRWVRHGILREWYPNGRRRSESDYFNGLTTGWVTRWYPNGEKAEETHYNEGVVDGKSARWSESGLFLGETIYKSGQIVNTIGGNPRRYPSGY